MSCSHLDFLNIPESVERSYYIHSGIYWLGLLFITILLIVFSLTLIFISIYEPERFSITE